MPFDLRVRVPDVAAAMDFYLRAFDGLLAPPTGQPDTAHSFTIGYATLHVLQENDGPSEYLDPKQKGVVPRLEVCVRDVPEATNRFVAAGGKPVPSPGKSPRYAAVLDPFGHMWTFSLC